MRNIIEGSQAIAETIKNIKPGVISAYPITPQTHIVETLAKYKADGKASYEYVRAESEFAAASIVTGASAAGIRSYSATSSQGLILMMEVLFNIAGMRLPVVMTCANRALGAPISIWNDHQDAMTMRDAGWIMLFAENHQEAVEQHILAFKIAEKIRIPVMVNIDGFVLTHTYEGVSIPSTKEIKKFLPDYKPGAGESLDVAKPVSFGVLATPEFYFEIRKELHQDLRSAQALIKEEYEKLKELVPSAIKVSEKAAVINNGLIEYYGPKNPKTVLIAMGSVIGTIKDVIDEHDEKRGLRFYKSVGVLKIKSFRPFPSTEILNVIKTAKSIAVIEKAISLGANDGPLATEIRAVAKNKINGKVQGFVVGLGGRDITKGRIDKIIDEVRTTGDRLKFVG